MSTFFLILAVLLLVAIVFFLLKDSSSISVVLTDAEREQDAILMEELRLRPSIQQHFQEMVIHGKTCLYNDEEEGVVKFIKVRKGCIRVGYLNEAEPHKTLLTELSVDLNTNIEEGQPQIYSVETGLIAKEVAFVDFEDWEKEYLAVRQLFKESEKRRNKKGFKDISLDEYLLLVNSKLNGEAY